MRDFVAATQYGIQLLKRDDDVAAAVAAAALVVDFLLVALLMLFDLVEHFRITGVLRTIDCHWSASFEHFGLRGSNRLFRLKFSQRYNAVRSIALRCAVVLSLSFTPDSDRWIPLVD